jgi:CubicO group peptidase (beta-lactamase class C family)
VDPETIFLVASITKPIVAAGAMLLVERGKICLDDLVARLVRGFGKQAKGEVQVRHLLTHTSGLPDMLEENLELRAEKAPLEVFVERICRVKLLFRPGTRISYQSCGIAMLGEIVNRVEGVPIREWLRREIFDSLGLVDTSLGMQADRRNRISDVKIPGQSFEYGADEATDWNWNSDYWRSFGAPWGGMFTTAQEMTALLQVFLYGGTLEGTRVLGPGTVAAMTTDQTSPMPALPEEERRRQRWGLGWRLRDRSISTYGDLTSDRTFGHTGATGTVAWVDPESGVTCTLFTNDPKGAGAVRSRVSNAVAGAVMSR